MSGLKKFLSGTTPTIFPSRFLGTTPKTGFFCAPPFGECQKAYTPAFHLPPRKDPEQPRIQEPMYRGWPGNLFCPLPSKRSGHGRKGTFGHALHAFSTCPIKGARERPKRRRATARGGKECSCFVFLLLVRCFGYFQGSLICPGYTSTGKRQSRSAACAPGCSATLRAQGPCGAPRGKSAS